MSDVISDPDGNAITCPVERERYQRFIRDEGKTMLDLYKRIEDPLVRASILNVVRTFARATGEKA